METEAFTNKWIPVFFGVIVVDKPEGMTSHDVVNQLRLRLGTSKIGHLGTLDPMATGVLPVCIGKATRLGQYFDGSPKEYIGEICFGFSTTTYDRQGEPTSEQRNPDFSLTELNSAMAPLIGDIEQIPALRSRQRKLAAYRRINLARRGKANPNAPAPVHVERFEITRFEPPFGEFKVVCGPGTYIRSLAHDLGQALSCGAHLAALRRTRSGPFGSDQAIPLDRISAASIIPIDRLLSRWPRIEAESDEEERKVLHGNPIPYETGNGTDRFARIFNKRGEFIAVAALENGLAHPRVVLTSIVSEMTID